MSTDLPQREHCAVRLQPSKPTPLPLPSCQPKVRQNHGFFENGDTKIISNKIAVNGKMNIPPMTKHIINSKSLIYHLSMLLCVVKSITSHWWDTPRKRVNSPKVVCMRFTVRGQDRCTLPAATCDFRMQMQVPAETMNFLATANHTSAYPPPHGIWRS